MSLKVLVLKENASHGATLAMVVTAMGHQVNVVATRLEASAELATSEYDVVVSSLHFEKASTLDFLRIVKAADGLRDKPFVFCCIRPGSIINQRDDKSLRAGFIATGGRSMMIRGWKLL